MMKDDPVPEQDHISRYCSPIRCTDDGRVTGAAFLLGEKDKYLSVNWLEFLRLDSRQLEIREVRRVLSSKLRLRVRGRIAVLNVGKLCEFVRRETPNSKNIRVLHEPEEDDPSHSGIYGLEDDNNLIAELMVEVIQDTYPALET